jgi:hypothetical protein
MPENAFSWRVASSILKPRRNRPAGGGYVMTRIETYVLATALGLSAALGFCHPGKAQSQTPTAATFDFTAPFIGADGKPMKDGGGRTDAEVKADPKCDACNVISIGQMAAIALYNDPKAAPDKKALEYALANRIRDNKAASLDQHERVAIEDCVNNNMSPLVAGQVDHLLEPDKYPEK